MAKIKKGDLVSGHLWQEAGQGRDRGKWARPRGPQPSKNRVIVEGVNYVTKHNRVGQVPSAAPRPLASRRFEARSTSPNVAIVDPSTKKPTRVSPRRGAVKDGVKRTVRVRFAKKSGKDL